MTASMDPPSALPNGVPDEVPLPPSVGIPLLMAATAILFRSGELSVITPDLLGDILRTPRKRA